VLELEQEFGISLAPEQVETMHDVATVIRVVEAAIE
jgi:acyl carrier protein